MAVLVVFAFVSGIVTILSPCILPVLPIVLSAGSGGGKRRPLGVVTGFAASFTFFTLALSTIVEATGIPADALRWLAVGLIAAFGAVLVIPALRDRFEIVVSRLSSRAASPGRGPSVSARGGGSKGFWSGIPVGISLGLVWTPCVGPIMASVISLAVSRSVDGGSVLITLAYTLGTSLPMFAVMAGGRSLVTRIRFLSRNPQTLQRWFGTVMIVVAVAMAFQLDRRLQTLIIRAFPSYGTGLTALENTDIVRKALDRRDADGRASLSPGRPVIGGVSEGGFAGVPEGSSFRGSPGDYGRAPEFPGTARWLNSPPLEMDRLSGSVVLVDFWTYSCVNCVRSVPYLRSWHDTYADRGLVVVGVHSPEFAFERSERNVAQAAKELGVVWPVVMDNDFSIWMSYANRYWPARYLVDREGRVRYWQFGEGGYADVERMIIALLGESDAAGNASLVSSSDPVYEAETEETYLGYARGAGLATRQIPVPDQPVEYVPARSPSNGEWTLSGWWTIAGEHAVPVSRGALEMGFDARDVYLVVDPEGGDGTIRITVDGKAPRDTVDVRNGLLSPREPRMYHIASVEPGSLKVIRLEVDGKIKLFAFTFG